MAENDIELSVGIKLDEAQFSKEYNNLLRNVSADTKKQIKAAVDETTGTAAADWGQLPFAGMHSKEKGARVATNAFLPSLAQDLQSSGYESGSLSYQSALINAAYRSSMSDPMQRFHRMLAMGLTQQADLTHPDTALGKSIETDYQLMSQPWSRDFIKQGEKGSFIDFAGMREYAVGAGLGKWIDEDGGHTADNFELINDELEKIEDKSNKTKKEFLSWGDALKGVLGTLTAIAGVGIKAFEVAYKASEAHVIGAGSALDKRRAFIGMSALDELKTKVASKSVGLGEDAIKNEIYSMSDFRERYKLYGQGDALPSALLNIFGEMVSSDDPYSAYIQSADKIYSELQGADEPTRRRWLLLMNQAGLGSMSSLVGQFLSNPEYAAQYKTPSALFNLKSNPYYNVYEKTEAMLPELTQLNASIKASYEQMYKDWEVAFGKPFKTWWDDTLKDKVVPWFESILKIIGYETSDDGKETREFEKGWDKSLKSQRKANSTRNREKISAYWSLAADKAIHLNDRVSWETYSPDKSMFNDISKEKINAITGDKPRDFLKALEVMTKDTAYRPGTRHDAAQSRAEVAWNFLQTTGFYNDLNDLNTTDIDKYTMRVIKEYLAEGKQDILDTYLAEAYTKSDGWKELLEFIREYKQYLKQHPEQLTEKVELLFNGYGGQQLIEAAKRELNR